MEFNKVSNYNIIIRHTINGGCIAKIGCVELSFSSPEDMMDIMKQYYQDPVGMEKEYNSMMSTDEVEGTPDDTGPTLRRGGATRGPNRNVEVTEEAHPDRRRQ